MTPGICIIIPARDEVAALPGLIAEILTALDGRDFTVLVVDDGSADGSAAVLAAMAAREPRLGWLRHDRPSGQSAAIRAGVRATRAPVIVTLDGDGQNPPDQIPCLLAPIEADTEGRIGLVQGQREKRHDTLSRRLASRFANRIREALLHDGIRDSGCGLKAFRRDAYLDLPWFDHIHRFMPAMMLREGWEVVAVSVTHRERQTGRSKYSNLGRALVGVTDLMGTAWLIRRGPPRSSAAPTRRFNQVDPAGGPLPAAFHTDHGHVQK